MSAQITRRGILGAAAAAPIAALAISPALGASSTSNFETALREYHRARDASAHDYKHGTLRAAYDRWERREKVFLAKYRDKSFAAGADLEQWDAYFQEVIAAEQHHAKTFDQTRRDAMQALFATPAPSPAALQIKVAVAEEEECEAGDILPFVKADLHRLATIGAAIGGVA